MRELMKIDHAKCVGCNRCIRVCPIDDANIAYTQRGIGKVDVDKEKCIVCGACVLVCHHESRSYEDDTERFFADLKKGVKIALMVAPAVRANLPNWEKIMEMLKKMGVIKVYDVSLGADICTWAHIRYIQKHKPEHVITQPCPAIVDYALMHKHELLRYLSPIQSPMLCAAIYMKKYQNLDARIGAISPCIAKSNEFEQTGGLISYNITFAKLEEYIDRHGLKYPTTEFKFDHVDSGLGALYSMPGGLKDNIEFFLGKSLRVDKCEGKHVYHELDNFLKESKYNLPDIFDVLNCGEGCNIGTACNHTRTMFQVNSSMVGARKSALKNRDRKYFDKLYSDWDRMFDLNDYIRKYEPLPVKRVNVTDREIEQAYLLLDKHTPQSKVFDCGACGSDTCRGFAIKLVRRLATPENCINKTHELLHIEQKAIDKVMNSIKDLSNEINQGVNDFEELIKTYNHLTEDINKISMKVLMISLNASIEATRAGDLGKGFAVVAETIRNLAAETQEATGKVTVASAGAQTSIQAVLTAVENMAKIIEERKG